MGQKMCKYLIGKYAMTKTLLPVVLGLAAILSPLRADDITLTDGTVLKSAKVVQRDDSTKTVTISFSGGIAQVHSEMVPATLATAQPPAVTNAVSQTTPVPQPPKPEPPSTPIPTDWTVDALRSHPFRVSHHSIHGIHFFFPTLPVMGTGKGILLHIILV